VISTIGWPPKVISTIGCWPKIISTIAWWLKMIFFLDGETNHSYMKFVQSIVLNSSTKLISSMDIFLWVRFYPSTSISFG
jgi:hypothetical protein